MEDEVKPVLVKGMRSLQLVLKGFRYVSNYSSVNTTYWRCENRDCPGKVTTDGELNVRNAHGHSHEPNPDEGEVKQLRADDLAGAVSEPSKSSHEVGILYVMHK